MYKETYRDLIAGHVVDTTLSPGRSGGDTHRAVDTIVVVAFVVALILTVVVL